MRSTTCTSRKWFPPGFVADQIGSSARGHAPLLAPFEVALRSVAGGEGRTGALAEDVVEKRTVRDRSPPQSTWDPGVEFRHDPVAVTTEVRLNQIRREQPDATADVESNAAGRDDTTGGDVGGGHASDREPVAPVDVGHGDRSRHDSGQVCHIGHLLDRPVLCGFHHERFRGEDQTGDVHTAAPRDLPSGVVDTSQLHVSIMPRSSCDG
jgi:hypothetical protein